MASSKPSAVKFDTLIIGAGLSGLAAGIRLAYYEQSVCILERHTTIGGLNSFYRLRGRNHDVGLHAMTNYVPKGTRIGPLPKLLKQLRFRWEDFELVQQNGSRVEFPGKTLRFSNDAALLFSEVQREFPAEFERFMALVARLDAIDFGDASLARLSARQVLAESLGDPLLVDMLLCPLMFYGSAQPDDMEFLQFAIMFRSIFREGFARPRQGIRLILKLLTRKYRELGGVLKLRAGVQRVVSEGDRAVGVVLDDGTEIQADRILSSAGAFETWRLCDRGGDAAFASGAQDAPGDITFVETLAAVDRQPADLGYTDTIIFYSHSPEFAYRNPDEPCDLRSGIICSPNNFQYETPLDEGMVRITALANKDYWMNLPEETYQAEKKVWFDKIVSSSLPFIPDFRPHVVDVDTFTPRTIRKFTGHIHGCVYGAPQKRWDGRTPLDGLYLIGTDQGYLGIVGSMLSGISMANAWALRDGAL